MKNKITFQKTVNGKVYLLYPYYPYEAKEFGRNIVGVGATKSQVEKDKQDLKRRGFLARSFVGENGKYYLYMTNKK